MTRSEARLFAAPLFLASAEKNACKCPTRVLYSRLPPKSGMRGCWNWQTGMTKDHVIDDREGSSPFPRIFLFGTQG